jgi:multiple sugar transport system permease protein
VTAGTQPLTGAPVPRRTRGLRAAERWWGPLYALPAVIVLIVFIGYPFLSIVIHSFTRWNGYTDPTFIGLKNFEFLLRDEKFLLALRNNLFFALSVPLQLTIPLVLAFLIQERIPGWRLYRWTYFLPAVFSTVVVGILARMTLMVDGPLNQTLGAVGLGGLEREWLGDASTALPAILVVVFWANFGYNVVMFLAGMSSIDPSLPEAARIDGANAWQVLRHVYLPGLRRVMEIVLVTSTITAFAYMFTYIFTITNGGPGFQTYVTEFYIYNNAFTFQRMGYASAIGLALTLVVAIAGFFQIRALTGGRE